MRYTATLLLAVFLLLIAAEPALAQSACAAGPATDNSLDRIVDLYRNCARQWEASLGGFALRLFWLLAAIEFAWSGIRLAFRNADLNEWLAELVNQVFFLGLFLALLTNATAWTGAIVESFRSAGAAALRANGVAAGIAPSDIFDTGVDMASKVLGELSIYAIPQSLVAVAAAFVILIAFALIAAAMILALVESYVVLSAGVLLMGFGGSRWTKDFALKTVIYAVSVGAKLFVLQLIAGLGAQVIGAWASLPAAQSMTAPVNTVPNMLIIVGSSLVLWVLVKTVPDMIQGLINGSALGMNTGLAGAAASLAGSATALGMAVYAARDLAREQITDAQAANSASSAPGMTQRTLGNIATAAAGNIGDRLSGRAVHGNRFGQMAGELGRQAEHLRGERHKQEKEAARTSGNTASTQPSLGTKPDEPPVSPQSGPAALNPGPAANDDTPPEPNKP